MKEFVKEIAVSVERNIIDFINARVGNNKKSNLTLNSRPESITKNTPQPGPRVEELIDLINEINIEQSPNKRKLSTSSGETKNQNQETQERGKDLFSNLPHKKSKL